MNEYVFSLSRIQVPFSHRSKEEKDHHHNIHTQINALVSINTIGSDEHTEEEEQEMERPVAISYGNQRIIHELLEKIKSKCTHSVNSCSTSLSMQLFRSLQWFQHTTFHVTVITALDALDFDDDERYSLVSILNQLGPVQFVLLRSEEELSDISSRNLLFLLDSIRTSENRQCQIRQVEDFHFELTGLYKEWLGMALPSVLSDVFGMEANNNMPLFQLEIYDNSLSLLPSFHPDSLNLHTDLKEIQILDIAPIRAIPSASLQGCRLYTRVPNDGSEACRTNFKRIWTLYKQLKQKENVAILQCKRLNGKWKEFYVLLPSEEVHGIPFVMFRMASAEEILFQPNKAFEKNRNPLPLLEREEQDLEMKKTLEKIESKTNFNPFDYESGALEHFVQEFQRKTTKEIADKTPLQLMNTTTRISGTGTGTGMNNKKKTTKPVAVVTATALRVKRGKKNTRRFL